jgi:hypothetical protein
MQLLSNRVLSAAGVLALVGISWLAVTARSQEKREPGTLYVDENGEPRIVGQPPGPEHVSLLRLIANRERYDGKEVITQGFCVRSYENTGLYLSREDAFHDLTLNGLVLDGGVGSDVPGEDPRITLKRTHLQYVTIAGRFHKLGIGHLHSFYGGALTDLVLYNVRRTFDDIPPLRTKEPEKGRR